MPTEVERLTEARAIMPEALSIYMIVRQSAKSELVDVDTTDIADALQLELRTVRKGLKALGSSRVGLVKIHAFDERGRCKLFLPYFEPPHVHGPDCHH